MCGGIGFRSDKISESELSQFYSDEDIKKFKQKGIVYSFFWRKNDPLPYINNDKVNLAIWGNKDKDKKLPQTGWAKLESLEEGKWDYLKPKKITIPASKGHEKSIWFDIEEGITGISVDDKDKRKHIYMLTKPASEKYLKLTKHDREPVLS